jgi:threonine dehydratase
MIIPYADIQEAQTRLAKTLTPTPLIKSEYFSHKLNTNIYFKLEVLNPTHSFKTRGATNAILSLSDEQRQNGVITASGGNHGLGVAYVASRLGIPAYIYLPKNTPGSKIEAFKELNAHTTLFGEVWDETNPEALRVAEEKNIAYIHPFDNVHVMAGQATIGLEIASQLDKVDAVVASIGGGGLIAGITSALTHKSPKTCIYGVETIGADSMAKSFHNNKITTLSEITSIANTLGSKKPGTRHFNIVREHVTDVVTVTDAQAVETLWEILNYEKLLVEPAMSCSLSAVMLGKIKYQPDDNIVIVVCGGNVTLEDVMQWRTQFGLI